MDRTQRGVTVSDRGNDHPDPYEVIDVVKLSTSHDHLLVDAVVLLWSAINFCLDFAVAQLGVDFFDHVLCKFVSQRVALSNQIDNLLVNLWVENREADVLEFVLYGANTQTVGQWCVNLQCLLGLALRRLCRNKPPSPCIV